MCLCFLVIWTRLFFLFFSGFWMPVAKYLAEFSSYKWLLLSTIEQGIYAFLPQIMWSVLVLIYIATICNCVLYFMNIAFITLQNKMLCHQKNASVGYLMYKVFENFWEQHGASIHNFFPFFVAFWVRIFSLLIKYCTIWVVRW